MSTAALPIEHIDTTDNLLNQNTPLLIRIADGDSQAVQDCLDRYSGLVWTLAKRYCRLQSDAEDACQEIFLELWQKAGSFDPDKSSETTFIAMIARRRLIDRYRRSSGPDEEAIDLDSVLIEAPQDEDRVELADEARKAANCMRKLSENQRKIIAMSIQHGKSHATISRALALPLGTVKSYARRSLLQLRDCMKRGGMIPQTGGGNE